MACVLQLVWVLIVLFDLLVYLLVVCCPLRLCWMVAGFYWFPWLGLVVSWILFGWLFGLFLTRFVFLVLLPLVVCLGDGLVVGLLGLCDFGWLLFNCLILVGVACFEVVVVGSWIRVYFGFTVWLFWWLFGGSVLCLIMLFICFFLCVRILLFWLVLFC